MKIVKIFKIIILLCIASNVNARCAVYSFSKAIELIVEEYHKKEIKFDVLVLEGRKSHLNFSSIILANLIKVNNLTKNLLNLEVTNVDYLKFKHLIVIRRPVSTNRLKFTIKSDNSPFSNQIFLTKVYYIVKMTH